MKLRALTIRNFRVHREIHVDFDESRTLIGGPNECGKSTLVEALHRAFFLKAKGTTELHRNMRSNHGGDPEVEVTFQVHGKEYHLKKRFGTKASTTLVPAGRTTLSGDAAESELATLLGLPESMNAKAAAAQWGHLWVWQGISGTDPSSEATTHQLPLLQRLQEMGGAVALQSDLDGSLAARFRTEVEAIFGDKGKPRAASDLGKAQADALRSAERKGIAEERLNRSLHAISEFEQSSSELATAGKSLELLVGQKAEVDKRAGEVQSLRNKETEENRLLEEATNKEEEFKSIHQKIIKIDSELRTRKNALAPLTSESQILGKAAESARATAAEAVSKHENQFEALKPARQKRDLLAALLTQFEKVAFLEDLKAQQEKVDILKNQLAELQNELARLPGVDEKKLTELRKFESVLTGSEAALKAMAAGLEVIETNQPIQVGGANLGAGESLVVTSDTDISIGDGIRLRIRPGGGNSLEKARADHQEARLALQKALEAIGVESTIQATEIFAKRRDLDFKIKTAAQTLSGWEASELPGRIAKAQQAAAASSGDVDRRVESMAGVELPATFLDAQRQLVTAEQSLTAAEQLETALKAVRDASTSSAAEAEKRVTKHEESIQTERATVGELEIQLRILEESHGVILARTEAITALETRRLDADKALQATRATLVSLGANLVAGDVGRLARSLEKINHAISEAKTRQAVASAILRSDGSEDPQADLAFETARHDAAEAHLGSVRRKAEAVRLLDSLFAEEQRSLANQFTQPLADTISGYLECLYGTGSRANVVFNENEFQGLELVRRMGDGGAFAFETLSGGAKEQVAAAMRLAMAEVLCTGFGGCLPVIFDDAFAYSDPQRVQTVQRMLDLAASRGLQVIVLTCTPADYVALGAKMISVTASATSTKSDSQKEITNREAVTIDARSDDFREQDL